MTVAQRLQARGYRTLMAGKWHLGVGEAESPAKWGFDRSFAMMRGESNHFPDRAAENSPDGVDLYREDGKEVTLPAGWYSTTGYVDKFIEYVDDGNGRQPFFGYLALTAPHSPLQAPREYIEKYHGVYDDGPVALAERRVARAKELGLLPKDVDPHTVVPTKDWQALSSRERAEWARRMEIYAGMIDCMDDGIGRVLAHLKRRRLLDDTYVVFLSDNGAAGALRETNRRWARGSTRT